MYTSELSPRIQKHLDFKRESIKRNFDNHVIGYENFGGKDYLEDMAEDLDRIRDIMKIYTCNHELWEDDYCIQCLRCTLFVKSNYFHNPSLV